MMKVMRNDGFRRSGAGAGALVAAWALVAAMSCARAGILDEVNVFIGTGATGHTTPAAAYPMGMARPGPDTGNGDWEHCSGYRFDDPEIYGFSQTHVSGTGCVEFGDIRLFPFSGEWTYGEFGSPYEKSTERASPGEYAVCLSRGGIQAEMTATPHVALHRYMWPENADRRLLVDFEWGLAPDRERAKRIRKAVVAEREDGFDGCLTVRRWGDRDVGFALRFSEKPQAVEKLPPVKGRGDAPRYVIRFGAGNGSVLVKVALSSVSSEGANRNLAAELPDWGYERVRASARKAWEKRLGVVDVAGGTARERRILRTALYHLFCQPNDVADVGEKPWHAELSIWDTFRAANPLYTILAPDIVDDIVNTLLRHHDRQGFLPRWNVWRSDTQCMVGNHAVAVAVDAYLKGFRGFDATRLMDAVEETLRANHPAHQLEDWPRLDKYGYYPFDLCGRSTATRLLEDTFDDWCAARLASALGRGESARFFCDRSRAYTNIFDTATLFMRGRDSQGRFREPFDPCQVKGWSDSTDDYVEANAWQYVWHVLGEPEDLIRLMGGRERYLKQLETFFTLPVPDAAKCDDVSGFVGQYAHGNEPSHHVAYLFQYAGRGDLTAKYVREIRDRLYGDGPDGLCGNEDCGQMSAWYVFSAAGFYPVTPCGGDYVLGVPAFPEMTLRVPGGKFRILAPGLAEGKRRVVGVKLNGQPLDGFILKHEDVVRGGTLEFVF